MIGFISSLLHPFLAPWDTRVPTRPTLSWKWTIKSASLETLPVWILNSRFYSGVHIATCTQKSRLALFKCWKNVFHYALPGRHFALGDTMPWRHYNPMDNMPWLTTCPGGKHAPMDDIPRWMTCPGGRWFTQNKTILVRATVGTSLYVSLCQSVS